MANETKSVRIESDVVAWVGEYVQQVKPKTTISSFVSTEIRKVKERIEKRQSSKKIN